jgi:hypothetical protein
MRRMGEGQWGEVRARKVPADPLHKTKATRTRRSCVYHANQRPLNSPPEQSNPSPRSMAGPVSLMEGAYSAGGPEGTRSLRSARKTRDVHIGTISSELKALIHRSCPADPPV